MESEGAFTIKHRESSFDGSKGENAQESKLTPSSFKSYGDTDRYDKIFWIAVGFSQAFGVTIVSLVVYWCTLYGGFAWSSSAELQFFYHPLLMVLGLVFCYGDAILVYRVLYFLPKWILKWIHGCLHLTAIVMSSIGLAAVFENHRRKGMADLYSLHSWVGIMTFSFFCLQYIGSFIAFAFPGLSPSARAKIMPFHTFFGLGIFLLAVVTCEMGLTERLLWTGNYTLGEYDERGAVGNSLGLFLLIFAFLVVFIATQSKYKRRALPSDVVAPLN